MRTALAVILITLVVGCCGSSNKPTPPPPPPDRFEVLLDQPVESKRHSNFSIMVIKDKKTEKEFKVIYSSSWGVVDNTP